MKPITVEKKVSLQRNTDSELATKARRKAATQALGKDSNHLVDDFVDLLDPFYPLEFKRSGVQHGVFKKLKRVNTRKKAGWIYII